MEYQIKVVLMAEFEVQPLKLICNATGKAYKGIVTNNHRRYYIHCKEL